MGNGTRAVSKGVPSVVPWDVGGKERGPLNTPPSAKAVHRCEKRTKDAPDQFLEADLKGPSHHTGDYFCQFYFGLIQNFLRNKCLSQPLSHVSHSTAHEMISIFQIKKKSRHKNKSIIVS